jgi:hypothetical protein
MVPWAIANHEGMGLCGSKRVGRYSPPLCWRLLWGRRLTVNLKSVKMLRAGQSQVCG